MSEHTFSIVEFQPAQLHSRRALGSGEGAAARSSSYELAASITRQASEQTYYTIRLLADGPRKADAFRAYAYFRWVDDMLDQLLVSMPERISFLKRQRGIMERCYRREPVAGVSAEERMIVDLIAGDQVEGSGLRAYIEYMMRVMAFDTSRRGRVITQEELAEYTRWLATAVTEALHHFIGHGSAAPHDETRYLAVTAAHVTHMLRDAVEDATVGYYNIPQEYLETVELDPAYPKSKAAQRWVKDQVRLARRQFEIGKAYLAQIENFRCRFAGYAYVARFQVVLDAIEKDGYRLRSDYPERKSLAAGVRVAWSALSQSLLSLVGTKRSSGLPTLISEGIAG